MKLLHLRQIFLVTACLFGSINLATMLPTTAQNSPSTPDSQLPPISPTTPNSPTTPSSSPKTPNSSTPTTPTQTTSPTPASSPIPTGTRKISPRSKPNRNSTPTPTSTTSPTSNTSPNSQTGTRKIAPRSTPGQNSPSSTIPSQTSPKSQSDKSSANTTDRQFVTKAAQSDMTEIQTSQLALNRSQNPQVLKYAQEMIQAHTDSTSKLKPIAAGLSLPMPKTLGTQNQALVDRLSRWSGTQFDLAYTTGQARAHAQTQSVFQNELQQGKNSELKAFAGEILPVVSMHLQMAKQLTAMR